MNKKYDLSKIKIEGDQIEIELEGVVVTGEFLYRNSGDFAVSITSPYQGISAESSHIPLGAQQFKNFLGPYGDTRAAEILTDLYRFCVYTEEHQEELLATLAEFDKALHYANYLDPVTVAKKQQMDAIAQEIKELKKLLIYRSTESANYQRRINQLMKEMGTLAFETNADYSQIFKKSFNAFEAKMHIGEVYVQSFMAYKDTPVWETRTSSVIQYLNALRDRETDQ